MSLRERLKKARLEKGISQKELAARIGRNQSAIGALESGRNKESTNIATIARVLDVDPVWLETGVGDMKNKKVNSSDLNTNSTTATKGYIHFKQLNVKAAAGSGKFNESGQNEVRIIEVSENWARKNIGNNFKDISIITASGDSMAPTFEDGDLLFVNTSVKYHKGDGVYVIDTPNGLIVKRIQTTINGDLKIISDNKNYDPEIIPCCDLETVHICGKVVAAWSLQVL
ncbi:XRE family transcriptional regulator [Snodgrassella alvi]|uniref:XRE family transcriptional regulator n=1 Tax=Snodgrassella alvi TaxID=1196083 RepID=UPI00345F6CB4